MKSTRPLRTVAPWSSALLMSALLMAAPLLASLLAACASTPPPPDWRLNAHSSLERAMNAHLSGDSRVAEAEFKRARAELSRTGRADQVARGELLRCAAQVASLVFEPCAGFEPLRADAPAAESAYADYLAGPINAAQAALLPPQQRAMSAANSNAGSDLAALQAVTDPLSRLVAAAVSLRSGRASPALIDVAINTASDQGWRRPLLAWLGVAKLRAAADPAEAERLQRRIQLVLGASQSAP